MALNWLCARLQLERRPVAQSPVRGNQGGTSTQTTFGLSRI